MRESIVQLDNEWIFVRHTDVLPNQPSILFIHGLGESGLSFIESFDAPELRNYNLVIPDLVGYGRSSSAFNADYSFSAQLDRLWRLVSQMGLEEFFLVGHSLGGDLATLMASNRGDRILGLLNVEGDLTPHDLFISNQATEAAERGEFLEWFEEEFKQKIVYEQWGAKRDSCRRYYASLWFCNAEAFLSNSRELYRLGKSVVGGLENVLGKEFRAIKVRKLFCWGQDSLAEGTRQYIQHAEIPNKEFKDAGHWVMIDRSESFYLLLNEFCSVKQ